MPRLWLAAIGSAEKPRFSSSRLNRKAIESNGKLAEARRTLENVLNEKKAVEKAKREKPQQQNR